MLGLELVMKQKLQKVAMVSEFIILEISTKVISVKVCTGIQNNTMV